MVERKVKMTPTDDRPKAPPDSEPAAAGPAVESAGDPDYRPEWDAHLQAEAEAEAPPVTASEVRRILKMIGGIAHKSAGDARFPEHWNFEPEELDDLEEPVAALVNRSARLRAAVHRSDAATVALVLFGWSMRNVELSKAIGAAEADIAGEDRSPGSVPEGAAVIDLGPLGTVAASEVTP